MTTAPLVPPEVDLTDFGFMPLEIERLRKSRAWLICRRRPELAFFMLNLWMRAWHERPAASIEDDDDVLADAAGCSPDRWQEVRADALRGWVKCADGRLYHPVVAKIAAEKWADKVLFRWGKECARIKKENQRRATKGLQPLDFPPRPAVSSPGQFELSLGQTADVPGTSRECPGENALKGEGEGECKGEGDSRVPSGDTESETPTRQRRAKRAPRTRAQLPEGWRPGDALRQWTIDHIRKCQSGVSAGHELEKFRDHWKATGEPKADWDATWRNWIREAIRREGKGNGTQRSNSRQGPARSSAIRTATNFAAALGGLGAGGPGGTRRGDDGDGMEAAHASHPSRNPQDGE